MRETYTLGIYGNEGGIEIGPSDTLELTVGETVTLLFNEGEPLHPGHNIVKSFDSQVVSIGPYSPTEVELTGQNPGEATDQAWDPTGNSGQAFGVDRFGVLRDVDARMPGSVSPSASLP